MTDVLIIYPPVTFVRRAKNPERFDYPPMGILYIAAVLEESGFAVKLIDASVECLSLDETIEFIQNQQPKIILISALTSNSRGAVELAWGIRKKFGEDIVIGIGGHHVSADPGIIERFKYFNFGITGEGEITIRKLVGKIIEEEDRPKGIFVGETPKKLDELPTPARHLIDFKKYKSLWANNIVASRGCPYHCIFCSRPAISKRVRFRSPELVVEEMNEVYQNTGNKNFMFLDDTINQNKRFLNELCDEIISNAIFKPKWNAQARLDYSDEKLAKKMSEAGCNKLLFGVESGNERIRNKIINKKISDTQIKEGIRLCQKHGIKSSLFLMMGFPTETQKELMDTVNLPTSLNPRPDEFGVHLTIPLPGAIIFKMAIEEGKLEEDIVDKWIRGQLGDYFNEGWPVYIPDGLTREEMQDAVAKMYRKFYVRPGFIFRRFLEDSKSPRDLKKDAKMAWDIITRGDIRKID